MQRQLQGDLHILLYYTDLLQKSTDIQWTVSYPTNIYDSRAVEIA